MFCVLCQHDTLVYLFMYCFIYWVVRWTSGHISILVATKVTTETFTEQVAVVVLDILCTSTICMMYK